MHELLLALTFITVIAVILLTGSVVVTALIVSVMFNLIAILYPCDFRGLLDKAGVPSPPDEHIPTPSTASPATAAPAQDYMNQTTDVYGPFYEQHHAYVQSYDRAYDTPQAAVFMSADERNYTVDGANALMAQRRARDKKCSDGWAVKDANFYKYNFGDELRQAEDRVWWGRTDY